MPVSKTYGRLTLTLDETDRETPAMVYLGNKASATWECAVETGVVTDFRTSEDVELTSVELEWLESHQRKVEAVFVVAKGE